LAFRWNSVTNAENGIRGISRPEVAAEIAEDEDKLFDRRYNRFFFVDECESVLE